MNCNQRAVEMCRMSRKIRREEWRKESEDGDEMGWSRVVHND